MRYSILSFLLGLALVGCSDSDSTSSKPKPVQESDEDLPRYVVATAISDDENSTTYVKTVSELDGQKLNLDDAREFGGWSDMKVIGPWVFVSSGEGPTVERFTVNRRGELEAAGRIGFGDYGETADMYMQILISPTKAYFSTDTEYVIWNPSKLEITGTLEYPELPTRDGIEPFAAMDRGTAIRDGKLYHAVSWTDTKNFKMTDDSKVMVVDVETDEIVEVLDAPCPDLNVATMDDDENIYFSNWVYSPGATLIHGSANACALKLPGGSDTFDDAWTVKFAEVADGHEGANLVYAGNNTALFSVFREDKRAHDPDTEIFDWLFDANMWEYASMDLETHEVTPLPDLGEQGGGFYAYRLDGRLVLLSPQEDYASTAFLELDASKNAEQVLSTNGWSTRIYPLDTSELED